MSNEMVDDPTIEDSTRVYRRISRLHVDSDPTSVDGYKITSAAFTDPSDGTQMSVHVGDTLSNRSLKVSSLLDLHPAAGLVSISAKEIRDLGLIIVRVPLPNDPAHAEIHGRKSKGTRRSLAKAARMEVLPK